MNRIDGKQVVSTAAPLMTCVLSFLIGAVSVGSANSAELLLPARSRPKASDGNFQVANQDLHWDSKKTAMVICDMWDQHWCKGATARVAEMAPRMNKVVTAAREQGVLIIHCPSSCMEAYKDTAMRKLAQQAPPVETKVALQSWCKLNPEHEAPLPIDDADGGCDCWPRCQQGSPWRRQIDAVRIEEGDAITDSGEAYYLMKQRGIENVIVMGVHTNMCVLGRPFSIRQMVYQGQNVVLMRDMTDTMYNSRSKPFVTHVQGTNRVIEHIEKFWCPTITSTAFTGEPAFRFSEESKPHVVFVISEPEYRTSESLPKFAMAELEPRGLRCTLVMGDEKDGNLLPGLEALKTADLMFLSARRRALPADQLQLVRDYLEAGKPVVAIRTSSHAFHTRGQHPEGHAEWQEFDTAVLGGNYTGHHGVGPKVSVRAADSAATHSILAGINVPAIVGNGSLYKVSPLSASATPLLIGTVPNILEEPIAWIHSYKNGRVFYTSFGHVDDFQNPQFNRLMVNAVFWGINRPVTEKSSAAVQTSAQTR